MKKFLIVVCIIAAICLLGYLGQNMDLNNLGNNVATSNSNVITAKNNTNTAEKTTANNKVENVTNTTNASNETKNETKNEVADNNTTNNTVENTNNNQEPAHEEVSVSNEDKAKDLAKKTYGTGDGVYFRIEQVESNGVYIISVRDQETTKDLAWYTVDVNNNSVK